MLRGHVLDGSLAPTDARPAVTTPHNSATTSAATATQSNTPTSSRYLLATEESWSMRRAGARRPLKLRLPRWNHRVSRRMRDHDGILRLLGSGIRQANEQE
jgi:hypothetical protein